jgi:hypothetical protein
MKRLFLFLTLLRNQCGLFGLQNEQLAGKQESSVPSPCTPLYPPATGGRKG